MDESEPTESGAGRRPPETGPADARASPYVEPTNPDVSALLSQLNHELRTPINVVLGFAQVLQMEPLTAGQREALGYIHEAARGMLAIADGVLELAQLESGAFQLTVTRVELATLVAEAASAAVTARPEGVTLDGSLSGVHVLADARRLGRVLEGIFSRAVTAGREPGSVVVSCRSAGPGRLRLTVSGVGEGAGAGLDKVLRPFDLIGAASLRGPRAGLGSGSALALLRAMGGELGVDAVTGRGQGLTIWMELADASKEPGAPGSARSAL